ncbi:anthocyanidin 5,3-O-glucosyltransferase-like [Canna indica]|uniref:Anthocyanidin 5,3-O-glucosyltransferase-like n=1 Tax=Canna indica TaxID=4628 RepID=A0AAQ3PZT0_9LILI|nr:anthocyanidin 5,3-O-glucosyltransferase-like [Canna indica]
MEKTVIMYPMHGMGHLVPMVELAKLFILHDFSVIVVLVNSPSEQPSLGPSKNPKLDAFVSRVSFAHPSISFHQLPPPPLSSLPDPADDPMVCLLDNIRLNNPQLRHFLVAHSHISNVCAVVLDFFCAAALDVTVELRLPSYGFFSSGACDLVAFHHLSMVHSATNLNVKDLEDAPLYLPELPPIPNSHLPNSMMIHNQTTMRLLNNFTLMLDCADGILVSTFESLEAQATRVLQDEAGVPGHRVPPVYCIGRWNSTLEAITAGVAMVAWPLYAEQRMNKVFLVELMKLAGGGDGGLRQGHGDGGRSGGEGLVANDVQWREGA